MLLPVLPWQIRDPVDDDEDHRQSHHHSLMKGLQAENRLPNKCSNLLKRALVAKKPIGYGSGDLFDDEGFLAGLD